VNALARVGNILFTGADAKGSPREFLKAWDLQTGQVIRTLQGHTNGVTCLATAPGLLFSGSDDQSIRIWDTQTMECVKVLQGHEAKVRCLCYSESEGRLYSGGHDSKVLVWDVEKGEQVGSLEGQSGWITAVLVNGDKIYTASTEKTVYLRNKDTGEKLSILNHESWVSSLALSGSVLFTGVGDATVCAWDAINADMLFVLRGHLEWHAVSALLVTGDTLVSVGWDGAAIQWSVSDLQQKAQLAKQAEPAVPIEQVSEKKGNQEVASSNSMFDETDIELLD